MFYRGEDVREDNLPFVFQKKAVHLQTRTSRKHPKFYIFVAALLLRLPHEKDTELTLNELCEF